MGLQALFSVVDVASAEDIFRMAQRLQTSHPSLADADLAQNKVGGKAMVPKQPQRKRR